MVVSAALIIGIIVTALTSSKVASATTAAVVGKPAEDVEKHKKEMTQKCNLKAKAASSSDRGEKIFSGLSTEETAGVIRYMMNQNLKLVPAVKAKLQDNYIFSVEHYLPNKNEVLQWLDNKPQRQPDRKAKVLLFMGKDKIVEEYIVWPIPNPRSKLKSRNYEWKSRPICNIVESAAISKFVFDKLTVIDTILKASFLPPNCSVVKNCTFMNMATRAVLGSDERHIILWFFVGETLVPDYYMYPLPFYIVISTKNNTYDYEIQQVYYNKQKYKSLIQLDDAYHSDSKIHYKLPNIDKHSSGYGSPNYVKEGDTADQTQRPPQQYYPDGPRFSVSGSHVQWLGWAFNIHPRTLTGMQLFDVKYKKERIAYELSMQDIVVLYSGNEPDDYFKNYFDNGWVIGRYNLPLVRGVDCPAGAIYLNSSIYGVSQDKGVIMEDAICVFEHRNSVPLRRHYSSSFFDWGYRYAFSMPDSVLVVRQIITVWNYDYLFDYEFHQNGAIEIKVSSTGYIAVTNNIDPSTTAHGFLLNPELKAVANLHQHMFNFKIDLDVGGIENNFKTIDISSQERTTRFAGSKRWYQMIAKENQIIKEKDAALQVDFDKPKLYVVYNNDKQVQTQGSLKKAYRIQSHSFSKVVLPDDSPLLKGGASWMKYQLAVTKYNDSERATASHFVQGDPFAPAVNFDDFIDDNDSLEDVDLVAWVTVGLNHMPTYEDLPVTTTPGKTLSVLLSPFNYFKRDPSINSRDAAVFWSKSFNISNSFLHQDNTCTASNAAPMISV